jgi:glutamate formiminotransferase/glutamate formiminotransferase/formiminotetrahydrofolate cyclodeaminase
MTASCPSVDFQACRNREKVVMRRLVESVPNIREGRDQGVIAKLRAGIEAVPCVALLDVHVDPDHNRSVFTIVGEPDAMETALFGLVQQAQHLIDLNRHQGEHPRIGVVDVIPWIPLQGVLMDDCVKYANALGARIGQELQIPVYLYEQAQRMPARAKLESIRRGGLPALGKRMALDHNWLPDYGPAMIHPTSGAIVVGVRFFLIAFNVVLESADLEMARSIAKSIRTSNGGLPALKAMGVPLGSRGLVQVSMNLTDYRETSLRRAFYRVCREAQRWEVDIVESEIVGLVPRAAWDKKLAHDLKLRPMKSDPIIEDRVEQSSGLRSFSIHEDPLLEDLGR